jgi:chromosome segregation ATPase
MSKSTDNKPLTGKAKEDYDARVAAQTEAEPKAKRKTLTQAERIAKLEAELAAARGKAVSRAQKQAERLTEQRKQLVAKRDELNTKIESVEAELKEAEALANADEATDSDTDQADAA